MNKSQATKKELLEYIKDLESQIKSLKENKKFGLVWEDQPETKIEKELKENYPTLKLVPELTVAKEEENGSTPTHVLIEGDNLHALTALQATHKGKIDVIYIDPPYNTGNKDFIYNDKYVNKEDTFRHSKWLSFMEKRLLLAKELLSDNGVIFVSIDDNEQAQLKMLMNQIFGVNNFISNFIWRKKFSLSFTSNNVINLHEYILCFRKSDKSLTLTDPYWNSRETKTVAPIFKSQNGYSEKIFRAGARLSDSIFQKNLVIKSGEKYLKSQTLDLKNDMIFLNGVMQQDSIVGGRFAVGQEFLDKNANDIVISDSGMAYFMPAQQKDKMISPISIIGDYTVDDKDFLYQTYELRKLLSTRQGTKELEKILGKESFNNPKPFNLIKELVKYYANDKATILDFFAGSGTTGHAVAALNAEDGGHRQAILVTNNENNICRDVTYKRMKAVLTGEWADGKPHEPLPGSLQFYEIELIPKEQQ